MTKRIHIVSFDVPYPADYGGVIDVFSRVKWFAENGWTVVLHCFEYKRLRAVELEKYAEVHYYVRPRGLKQWFSCIPFIVKTRINPHLAKILSATEDEVILEGLHCAYYLHLQPGNFYVRTHNVEHVYYARLAKDASFFKKIYFRSEAKKLKEYESILIKAKALLVISPAELAHFQAINEKAIVLPSCVDRSEKQIETKPYILFHGNLSVEENAEAALWILKQIQPQLQEYTFVLAGKNPTLELQQQAAKSGVQLVANPAAEAMEKWVQEARIHLLWSNNPAGVKLKFLQALSSSGHIICNANISAGSQVQSGFITCVHPREVIDQIRLCMLAPLEESSWQNRQNELEEANGVQKLKELFR